MKGFRVLILLSAACLLVPCAAQAVSVTVDASSIPTGQIGLRLGHNMPYNGPTNGQGTHFPGANLWDVEDPLSDSQVKTTALEAIQYAGTLGEGLVRFPGGTMGEGYHWRRGVGDPNARPADIQTQSNAFGTDDLMMFITQMNAAGNGQPARTAKPLITVNWWQWNNPANVHSPVPDEYDYDPDKGVQEAANWVEYCNGVVTPDMITCAVNGGWQPSSFLSPTYPYPPSTDWNAVETADETHSWLSTEAAPAGYFAWLRYNNLTTYYSVTGSTALNGYGVKYWETGNEDYKYWYGMNPATRPTWPTFCANYKNAVSDYSTAMKAMDSAIKIGALLDNNANMKICSYDTAGNPTGWTPADTPGPTFNTNTQTWDNTNTWDTTVLNATPNCADFFTLHLGVGDFDERYGLFIYGPREPSQVFNDAHPPRRELKAVQLEAGHHYTFEVRATAIPSGSTRLYCPTVHMWLIPCSTPPPDPDAYNLSTADQNSIRVPQSDTRQVDTYAVRACNPWVNNDVDTISTQMATSCGSDYTFVLDSAPTTRWYVPWVKIGEDETDGRGLNVALVTCEDGTTGEQLMEFRPGTDQTNAVFAAPRIISRHLEALQDYKPGIELIASETAYAWGPGVKGQTRSLKGALFIADLYREMIDPTVDSTNTNGDPYISAASFWSLNDDYYHIAQPNWLVDPITGSLLAGSWPGTIFFHSPIADAYHLFTNYLGDNKLAATLSANDTYDSARLDGIAATTDTPYLSRLASSKEWYTTDSSGVDTYHRTVYLMVINKYSTACPCSFAVHLGFVPTSASATWHILQSHSETPSLDDENDPSAPDRIRVDDNLPVTMEADTAGMITTPYLDSAGQPADLPPYSVAVLELNTALENTSSDGVYAAHELANEATAEVIGSVTAVFGNTLYVENCHRSSGIRVDLSASHTIARGDLVSVSGTMKTSGGERYISTAPTSVTKLASPAQELRPVAMVNKFLGGAGLTTAPDISPGLYNVGLLVTTVGAATYTDSSGEFFYVDDGCALGDGSGNVGLRVDASHLPACPDEDAYVAVTGISSVWVDGGMAYHPQILPRDSADAVVQAAQGQYTPQQGSRMLLPPPETLTETNPVEGTIDYALAQADNSSVSLNAVQVVNVASGYFGVKEAYEIVADQPRLLVARTCQVGLSCLVDVQGTITTDSFGKRIITSAGVWVYTDAVGRALPPNPQVVNTLGVGWPFKLQIQ